MGNENEIIVWNDLKVKLKQKYPTLTGADLQWRYSSQEDLIETIALKLEITAKEVRQDINEY